MIKFLLVMIGGGLGALLRYLVSFVVPTAADGHFPWNTLTVNVGGAFVMGLLWGLSDKFSFSLPLRVFLFVGLLGGFTTFSAYSFECFDLFKNGAIKLALVNIFLSNVFCIVGVFLGFAVACFVTGWMK